MVKIKYSRIKRIRRLGKRRVYDIHMKKNHNFLLSSGILSHNSETRGMIEGSADLVLLGRLPSENDRIQATAQLYRDNLITKKQITDIAMLSPGEYYIAEVGKKVKKRYFLLPRTMYWKPGYGNFYSNIWGKLVDRWNSVKEEKDKIFDDMEKSITILKEKEALRKLQQEERLRKQKEDEIRQKEEERQMARDARRKLRQQDKEDDEEEIEDDENTEEEYVALPSDTETKVIKTPPISINNDISKKSAGGLEIDLW